MNNKGANLPRRLSSPKRHMPYSGATKCEAKTDKSKMRNRNIAGDFSSLFSIIGRTTKQNQ